MDSIDFLDSSSAANISMVEDSDKPTAAPTLTWVNVAIGLSFILVNGNIASSSDFKN